MFEIQKMEWSSFVIRNKAKEQGNGIPIAQDGVRTHPAKPREIIGKESM
jgi:hypothetical protein